MRQPLCSPGPDDAGQSPGLTIGSDGKRRCFGNGKGFYAAYHDNEWGVPVHDDRRLFEFLVLEGAQAGLSWEAILRKREGYRRAFREFDPALVARMEDSELTALRSEPGIVRNRLKIESARRNARVFLEIQAEFGSFYRFLWDHVGGVPLINDRASLAEVPVSTPTSDELSRRLKSRGMNFVGTTIIYAFMQAVGLVDDHVAGCWKSADRALSVNK